ncbi:hypothetical protein FRZ44_21490 [Hypericibacter terrae]|uniref:Type II toxin-antitoxin system RelE/ParE family toxin n=1 Tax=Hypericibacter terrae TaxID=2602015 RepID=A0A5J6MHC9_9PROT|nr:hypothetical protein FRZ44_21490 [Hypericibacter terrae]
MQLIIAPAALKSLGLLPKKDALALLAKLEEVAADPFGSHPWATRLQGSRGYRWRHGSWRAIYRIDTVERTVVVEAVGNRKEIYR